MERITQPEMLADFTRGDLLAEIARLGRLMDDVEDAFATLDHEDTFFEIQERHAPVILTEV